MNGVWVPRKREKGEQTRDCREIVPDTREGWFDWEETEDEDRKANDLKNHSNNGEDRQLCTAYGRHFCFAF